MVGVCARARARFLHDVVALRLCACVFGALIHIADLNADRGKKKSHQMTSSERCSFAGVVPAVNLFAPRNLR